VPDKDDLCPVDPGPAANHGCPIADRDGDGIPDDIDKCPDEPEDYDGWSDEDGCPDPDNDGDGILDKDDACPNEPGIPEMHGCPPADRDGDGVPDHIDKCPDEPGPIDNQGCPKKYSLVVLRKEKIEIKQQVHFDTNKWVILKDSFEMLNQVASVLKDYPKIRIRIEGHTDSVADDDFNLKLSQKRADAVREFLVNAGIGADRLTAVGYGETMPIASNKTAKGRAANRRVEFNITEK
jgi:outer membrane protein OmpA-like peptidoglycan-associated protein